MNGLLKSTQTYSLSLSPSPFAPSSPRHLLERLAPALLTCSLLAAANTDETVARVYLVEYAGRVDVAFVGRVAAGGVNRAVFEVTAPLGGVQAAERVVVAGFNTVEFNSAHYRLNAGDERLVFGYRAGDTVYVPSPYSGCFPVEAGRVVATLYAGASPVSLPREACVRLLAAFYQRDAGDFEKAIAAALASGRIEERYLALVLAGLRDAAASRLRIEGYLKDDNPVLREAAMVSLARCVQPASLPSAMLLDAQGVCAVWRIIKARLDHAFGRGMTPWVEVVADFVAAAEEMHQHGRDASDELRQALTSVVNDGLEFLWLAAPFSTKRVGELLAYQRLRPAVLQVLAVSLDPAAETLAMRFVDDADAGVSLSAAAALRRIRCQYQAAFGDTQPPRARWQSVRILETLADDLRDLYALPALHAGDYPLFRLALPMLLAGSEFRWDASVVWRELAQPAATPVAALLPFGATVYDRLYFFELAAPLVRRFPEAAPLLEHWVHLCGRFGGPLEKRAALEALPALPVISTQTLLVLREALAYEDALEVPQAAFNAAQRLRLPLLFYRYMEEPQFNREPLAAASALWRPFERPFSASTLPVEKAAAEHDASYTACMEALRSPERAAALLKDGKDGREKAFAAAGLALVRLSGHAVPPIKPPSELPAAASVLLKGYGVLEYAKAGELEGVAHRAEIFGAAASGKATAISGELAGSGLFMLLLGCARAGDAVTAWRLLMRNAQDIDADNYRALADTLSALDLPGADETRRQDAEALLASDSQYARSLAAILLYRAGGKVPADAILRLLGAEQSTLRCYGCDLAAVLREPALIPALSRMLADYDPYLVVRAARALACIGGQPAAALLRAAQANAFDRYLYLMYLRYAVAADVGGMGDAYKVLASSDWNARYYSVLGMADARFPSAKQALLRLILDPRERLAALAEVCLIEGAAPELALDALANHPDAAAAHLIREALRRRLAATPR